MEKSLKFPCAKSEMIISAIFQRIDMLTKKAQEKNLWFAVVKFTFGIACIFFLVTGSEMAAAGHYTRTVLCALLIAFNITIIAVLSHFSRANVIAISDAESLILREAIDHDSVFSVTVESLTEVNLSLVMNAFLIRLYESANQTPEGSDERTNYRILWRIVNDYLIDGPKDYPPQLYTLLEQQERNR